MTAARKHELIECHVGPSPLGPILYRAEDDCLTGLFFIGQKHFPPRIPEQTLSEGHPKFRVIEAAREQIAEYFAGAREDFSVAVRLKGTPFQQQVWDQLRQIPFGEAWTYGDLARRLGLPPGASRAVGGANGRNSVAIIVPCHRVIGGDGKLTGYAGGVERKRHLLTLEGGRGTRATGVVLTRDVVRRRSFSFKQKSSRTTEVRELTQATGLSAAETYGVSTISTRRFSARPALVAFEATGLLLPKPFAMDSFDFRP